MRLERSQAFLAIALLVLGFWAGAVVGTLAAAPSAPATQVSTQTQYVAKGQTWYYLAFYGPSLASPPDSAGPGSSFAVINADTWWTAGVKDYPELMLAPGQTKDYQVRLFFDPSALPMTGRLVPIDGFGLSVHFSNLSVSGPTGGGIVKMTVGLAANSSWGLDMFQIPVMFSTPNRLQPVSFGPIYLVSGFPGQKVNGTSQSGQPTISFQDDAGRGYGVDLVTRMNNTLMLQNSFGGPLSTSVCAGLDPYGGLLVTNSPVGWPCDPAAYGNALSFVLKPGWTTSVTFALKLVTQVGVQLGFSVQRYGSTHTPPYTITFSPSTVTLQPGVWTNITVTTNALGLGSDGGRIEVSAVTLDGCTVV